MSKAVAVATLSKVAFALSLATGFAMAAAEATRPGQEQPAGADGLVFYACAKGGKVIPGSIHVDESPNCNGGASLVWWYQAAVNRAPQVKAFGGVVAASGRILSGNGFTVERLEVGKYLVTFARGVVARGSAMTVTPYFTPNAANNYFTNAAVTDTQLLRDGSRYFEITMSATTPTESPMDGGFMFIVAGPAPLSPQPR